MSVSASVRSSVGPPSLRFAEATKNLAKTYYPYIYVDKRRLSKPVVDLQSSLEVCTDALDECDKITKDLSSLDYAQCGLEQGLERAVSELSVIQGEIRELVSSLKESERFNLRLFDQLSCLDRCMTEGIESGENALGKSKNQRTICNRKAEKYRVPRSTKEALENTLNGPELSAAPIFGMSNLLVGEVQEKTLLPWIVRIQRELAHRHAEFSFLVIGLWTEGVFENHELIISEPSSCFPKSRNNWDEDADQNKGLLLAHKGRVEDTPATIDIITTKVYELGTQIFEQLGNLKEEYAISKKGHDDLTAELAERRRQLMEGLLASHSAVQSLLILDEQNDALVGKLIKTRPLFAELHEALVRGELDDKNGEPTSGEGSNYQLLTEVLGPDGWSQLLSKLQTVRLPQTNQNLESNQNANPVTAETSTFFANARNSLRRARRSLLTRRVQ